MAKFWDKVSSQHQYCSMYRYIIKTEHVFIDYEIKRYQEILEKSKKKYKTKMAEVNKKSRYKEISR